MIRQLNIMYQPSKVLNFEHDSLHVVNLPVSVTVESVPPLNYYVLTVLTESC